MSEHIVTPEMIEAGACAVAEIYDSLPARIAEAAYRAMESARLEGEEAARQERMKAREVAR